MTSDRFIRFEPIGVGGMGRVCRAYDRDTGAVVALKELHVGLARTKDIRRFIREIEHLSTIRHPHVIRLVHADARAEPPFYVMEYCPRGDLNRWLEANPSTNDKWAAFWQLCSGLAALHQHEKHLIHRDLKPQNVLLGEDSNFKISDLGLSLSMTDAATRVTTSNWFSRGFSPPEQVHDMSTVDERGDIYSLGAILFYMMTGHDCAEPVDLTVAPISKDIRNLLMFMIDESPANRFGSVAQIWQVHDRINGSDVYLFHCPQCGGPAIAGVSYEIGHYDDCLVCDYERHDGIE